MFVLPIELIDPACRHAPVRLPTTLHRRRLRRSLLFFFYCFDHALRGTWLTVHSYSEPRQAGYL
jgi:hypothetical protein